MQKAKGRRQKNNSPTLPLSLCLSTLSPLLEHPVLRRAIPKEGIPNLHAANHYSVG
jgi:hypothetical protein